MTWTLFLIQLLNGLSFGVLLFLMTAGLTLVFGIMNFVNLAHGSLYMIGAYCAALVYGIYDSFALAGVAAIVGAGLTGLIIERVIAARLYQRDHLDHVLATFGLILFFNELVRVIWGASPVFMNVPDYLSGAISFLGINYPLYRLVIIVSGLATGLACYLLINKTRIGMLIRAGSVNPAMVSALGVNVNLLKSLIFALGAALAGLAGFISGPILSVQPAMGDSILITALIVIVIGGIGSIRGAFFASLIVGVIDTFGRSFLPLILREFLDRSLAQAMGPALASLSISLFMAVVLAFKPNGLFPVSNR